MSGKTRKTVLVVEDEEDIQQLVCYHLIRSGYEVVSAVSGEEALDLIGRRRPDLVILDIMLPGVSGLELCRNIRERDDGGRVPVILLTARGEENDIVTGFAHGADDYVTKPFSPAVLMARVAAVLRRGAGDDGRAVIEAGGLVIDPDRHLAELDGRRLDLTPTEFAVLHLLASRPGWVFSRDRIIDAVRGQGYAVTPRAVDVQVFGLRRKLGPAGRMIETVRGVGYRFDPGK